jgi:hypothetical protein
MDPFVNRVTRLFDSQDPDVGVLDLKQADQARSNNLSAIHADIADCIHARFLPRCRHYRSFVH